MTKPNFNRAKYDELFSHGLPSGLGSTEKACVMACLNLACGGSLTDAAESPCVLPAAASFAIRLNDANWSSEKARADGLYDLGLALLGTNEFDRQVFLSRLTEQTIRQVVPVFLRRAKLEDAAMRCESEGTRESAMSAKKRDFYAAFYAGAAAADAAFYAAAAAFYAAAAAADAAFYAAFYAGAAAADAAAAAADAAFYAAAPAAPAASAKYGDETLVLSARIATKILTDMKEGR